MSDSLNCLAKALVNVEGGGALPDRYIDWLKLDGDQTQAIDAEAESTAIVSKIMKDLGGSQ